MLTMQRFHPFAITMRPPTLIPLTNSLCKAPSLPFLRRPLSMMPHHRRPVTTHLAGNAIKCQGQRAGHTNNNGANQHNFTQQLLNDLARVRSRADQTPPLHPVVETILNDFEVSLLSSSP